MEGLNQESKLGLCQALCYAIPYCFRAAADERVTVPCITALPLPQPQRVLQDTGVTEYEPEAARIPVYPTTGPWEKPEKVLASWH